jgi:hypothetical protein
MPTSRNDIIVFIAMEGIGWMNVMSLWNAKRTSFGMEPIPIANVRSASDYSIPPTDFNTYLPSMTAPAAMDALLKSGGLEYSADCAAKVVLNMLDQRSRTRPKGTLKDEL